MVLNNYGNVVKINGTYFNLTSKTDFCTLIATYSNQVSVNVYLNISYFYGNITGNNFNNYSLVMGKTLSTSYLLINNTYICVRGWYPNYYNLGTINATTPS